MIDLATLTGAMIVALGTHKAGFFATDDGLAEALSKAGEATGEAVWRMPLGGEYDREIDSDIADVKNIAASRFAGSIIAAVFLQRFVKDVPLGAISTSPAWYGRTSPSRSAATAPPATGCGCSDRMVADSTSPERRRQEAAVGEIRFYHLQRTNAGGGRCRSFLEKLPRPRLARGGADQQRRPLRGADPAPVDLRRLELPAARQCSGRRDRSASRSG